MYTNRINAEGFEIIISVLYHTDTWFEQTKEFVNDNPICVNITTKKMESIKFNYNGVEHEIEFTKERFLRQFEIGRKDKNGTPIKEGDIIENMDKIEWGGVVTYSKKACAFAFDNEYIHKEDYYSFSGSWQESQQTIPEDDWLVVGSIYDYLK